ncbi:xylulose kinase [Aulographum hederae CBS 113979]|uniref:Xylulose kinase n=1 Tax=Aulographum hederae CBS 113979 TaxID=1176131 RepID=A0A6G1HG78_9PEZI|nr:xylulose kinase [Aulographum hederae CBS 113979]
MAENTTDALYMGFDLSTQQLKGIVVKSNLKLVYEAKVDFDADLGSKYGIEKGVLTNPPEGEIFAPVAMWLEAFDLVLQRLKDAGLDFSKVKGVSGAGMQHGTVFWSKDADELLQGLDAEKSLLEQLKNVEGKGGAFSHEYSPNWQDASTQEQCEAFDGHLGSTQKLAEVTGSKAHHRFSGPQILRFRQKYPSHYEATARISLVSSFVASMLLGKVAPIDIGDVCGMNLWDINAGGWHETLLALAAGSEDKVPELKKKLGPVPEDGGETLGSISKYYVSRYGFPSDCEIIACTGDNPSTILALPLRESDAIVSLGTSTTFLMSTPHYKPDPAYHFMNHPATAGLYMFMLCYKNGGLAREHVRDALNEKHGADSGSWDQFNKVATSEPPVGQEKDDDPMKLGLFFPRPEIVPNVHAGIWRYLYSAESDKLQQVENAEKDPKWPLPETDARAIVESQFLSLRLRSQNLVSAQPDPRNADKKLPPQPRRIYLVGGGAVNPAIAQICGEVIGGAEGVFRLDIGGNACALGSAYKAVWGCEREGKETFEQLVEARWDEEGFVERIADGYCEGVWERYGESLKGFEGMEGAVLEMAAEGRKEKGGEDDAGHGSAMAKSRD